MDTAFVPVQPPASVAVTVALKVPVTEGVPASWPFADPMERPAGWPVIDHTMVPFPFAWEYVFVVIAVLNTRLRFPAAGRLVTLITGQATTKEKFCVALGDMPLLA